MFLSSSKDTIQNNTRILSAININMLQTHQNVIECRLKHDIRSGSDWKVYFMRNIPDHPNQPNNNNDDLTNAIEKWID